MMLSQPGQQTSIGFKKGRLEAIEEEGAGRRMCAHCWGGEGDGQSPTP